MSNSRKPHALELNAIADFLGINKIWHLTGEGDTLSKLDSPKSTMSSIGNTSSIDTAVLQERTVVLEKENSMQAEIIEGLKFKISVIEREIQDKTIERNISNAQFFSANPSLNKKNNLLPFLWSY
ncbi:hypothetical protein [Flavobacterium sp. LAR06]|uniref:hypothetical protein n=1 Tax=Flavobacterium sp. LAR06 TaxID=3064897 RepID=UPI0035C02119